MSVGVLGFLEVPGCARGVLEVLGERLQGA